MLDEDPRLDPTEIRSARFPGSFRRYDAKAVEEFLESVASRVLATNQLVDDLRRELDSARLVKKLAPEDTGAPAPEVPDMSTMSDEDLVQLVGEETAHVLSTARKAATDIRSKAEESTARLIREATAEADRLMEEAEETIEALTAEAAGARDAAVEAAEADATAIREQAETESEQLLASAREEAARLETANEETRRAADEEKERILEEAREEGRAMVNEAKEVRTRILEDLQRRRALAREQVEKLLAGRERILEAYAAVRENVDEITAELGGDLFDEPADPALEAGFVGIVTSSGSPVEDEVEVAPSEEGPVDQGPIATEDSADDEIAADEIAAEDVPDEDSPTEDITDEEHPDEPAEADVVAEEALEDGPVEEEPALDVPEAEAVAAPDDVESLFERIRAQRAESVARAQQVLAGDDAQPEPEAEVEPESEPEAEPATEAEAPSAVDDEPDEVDETGVDRALLADADALNRRQEALAPLDKKLSRALKRHLADEQNVVLDALRRTEATGIDALVPPIDEHVGGYAGVADRELRAAADAGATSAGSAADVDVSDLAHRLGETLIEPFRRRIERSASELDGDPDALDERLRALYREWKVEHIASATTDALLSAYAAGQYAAAAEGATLHWRIDPAQGPCPDAQDNALAGATVKGEPFPTGDRCPQAHPGCRCLLVVDA